VQDKGRFQFLGTIQAQAKQVTKELTFLNFRLIAAKNQKPTHHCF
jgi:hypothetical protein